MPWSLQQGTAQLRQRSLIDCQQAGELRWNAVPRSMLDKRYRNDASAAALSSSLRPCALTSLSQSTRAICTLQSASDAHAQLKRLLLGTNLPWCSCIITLPSEGDTQSTQKDWTKKGIAKFLVKESYSQDGLTQTR